MKTLLRSWLLAGLACLAGCSWLKTSTPSCTVSRDADGSVSVSCELKHEHDAKGNVK
jgi:hypothetical protein